MIDWCQSIWGYNNATHECQLHHRALGDNSVGWRSTKLDFDDAHALGEFCNRLYKAGIERGRQEVAAAVQAALPPSPDQTSGDS